MVFLFTHLYKMPFYCVGKQCAEDPLHGHPTLKLCQDFCAVKDQRELRKKVAAYIRDYCKTHSITPFAKPTVTKVAAGFDEDFNEVANRGSDLLQMVGVFIVLNQPAIWATVIGEFTHVKTHQVYCIGDSSVPIYHKYVDRFMIPGAVYPTTEIPHLTARAM